MNHDIDERLRAAYEAHKAKKSRDKFSRLLRNWGVDPEENEKNEHSMDYEIDIVEMVKAFPTKSDEDIRDRYRDSVLESINGVEDPIRRKEYLYALSKKTRVGVKLLEKRMRSLYGSEESDGKKFHPDLWANKILSEYHILFSGSFLIYRNGIYEKVANEEIRSIITEAGKDTLSKGQKDAIVDSLKTKSFVRPTEINKKNLLAFRNCILDTETMEAIPFGPQHYVTSKSPIEYDPDNMDIMDWFNALDKILPNPELQDLLQEIFGYCLTARTDLHKAFIFFGDGRNGKSFVTEVLAGILGSPNVSTLSMDDLSNKFFMAELNWKRLNISTEIDRIGLVKDGTIKGLIAGDPILVHRKYQEPFEMTPVAKFLVAGNHLPRTADTSSGFFRRWVIVPFNETLTDENSIPDYSRFMCEKHGTAILNWAIWGYKRLVSRGDFKTPDVCAAELEKYQIASDHVLEFITEKLTPVDDKKLGSLYLEIYRAYKDFCQEGGYHPLGRNNFYRDLEVKTKRTKRFTSDKKYYLPGLVLSD